MVLLNFSTVHLNPKYYPDPLKFNPWRWKVTKERPRELHVLDFSTFSYIDVCMCVCSQTRAHCLSTHSVVISILLIAFRMPTITTLSS